MSVFEIDRARFGPGGRNRDGSGPGPSGCSRSGASGRRSRRARTRRATRGADRGKGRRHGARLQSARHRRQDAQALGYRGKPDVVLAWFPKAFTRAAPSSASRSRRTATRSEVPRWCTSWRASTPIEENIKFAKATSVHPLGEGGQMPDKVVEKKEADFPMLSRSDQGDGEGVPHE